MSNLKPALISTWKNTFVSYVVMSLGATGGIFFGLYNGEPSAINAVVYNSVDFVLLVALFSLLIVPLFYCVGLVLGATLPQLIRAVYASVMRFAIHVKENSAEYISPKYVNKLKETTHETRKSPTY